MAGQPKLDIGVELTAEDEKIMRGEGVEQTPEVAPEVSAATEIESPKTSATADGAAGTEPGAAAEQAKPEVRAEDPEAKFVPLAALKEERIKRQEAEKRGDEKYALLEQRLALLADRVKPKEEPAKPPAIKDDPLGAVERHDTRLGAVEQSLQNQDMRHRFATHVAAQVNAYKTNTPDYDEAYKFARNSTISELKARGFSDTEIPGVLENGEFQLATEALTRGKNVAQHLYDFAVARGYRKAEAAQAVAAVAPVAPAQDKLETIRQGQQAAKSLGSMGGGSTPRKTLESLASMSEKDFAALPEDEIERILRGI